MNADQTCVTWWNEHVLPHLIGDARASQSRAGHLPREFLASLTDAIVRLSNAYVQREHHVALPDPVRQASDAVAYATYFGLINFTKFDLLLNELSASTDGPMSVLDFGCGPATASLAALRKFPSLSAVTLIDHSSAMLSLSEDLLRGARGKQQLQISRSATLSSPRTGFDLVLAGNVLCELPIAQRTTTARFLFELVNPGGHLVLLEPGQPKPTRALMELRNSLFADFAEASPVFPCTHRAPCPMLTESVSDWCHTELGWERPYLVAQLDEALGFNKRRLKFSALVLRNGGSPASHDEFRIVGPSQRNPRGVVLPVCGPGYFGPVVIGKKASAECRVIARRARWFDRIAIEPKPAQSYQQVTEIRPGL
jgi:ribosomal protein RSM22 (predicted rRNA methylase)